jgi:hypothetical protein
LKRAVAAISAYFAILTPAFAQDGGALCSRRSTQKPLNTQSQMSSANSASFCVVRGYASGTVIVTVVPVPR